MWWFFLFSYFIFFFAGGYPIAPAQFVSLSPCVWCICFSPDFFCDFLNGLTMIWLGMIFFVSILLEVQFTPWFYKSHNFPQTLGQPCPLFLNIFLLPHSHSLLLLRLQFACILYYLISQGPWGSVHFFQFFSLSFTLDKFCSFVFKVTESVFCLFQTNTNPTQWIIHFSYCPFSILDFHLVILGSSFINTIFAFYS